MKNYEKYADELRKYEVEDLCNKFIKPNILKKDNCSGINCTACSMRMMLWLLEDCEGSEVDWNKVEVNTPILVRDCDDDRWIKRYFAKYENEIIYAWNSGATSWSTSHITGWKYAKLAESEVDWSKVEVDTPILVRYSEKGMWIRRKFAKFENGVVYAWRDRYTSWTVLNNEDVTAWKYAKLAEGEKECKEPKVDWSKVEVDTPILVKDRENGDWLKRYFAKYEDGYTYSNRMTVAMSSTNSSKYFKIEPIKWRVLNPNAAEGEKKILLAEKCLTANIPYYGNNDYSTSYGANRYKFSNVRAYLNGIPNQWITDGRSENDYNIDWSGRGFLQSAFTNAAISLISDTVVRNDLESTGDSNNTYTCDNTTDKIFLPSLQEITNSDYAFQPSFSTTDVNRKRESTDYAKANYCNSTVMYFLRSPSKLDYDRCKCVAGADGKGRVLKVIKSDNALVPALCLNE